MSDPMYYNALAANTDSTKYLFDTEEVIKTYIDSLKKTVAYQEAGKTKVYRLRPYQENTIEWMQAKLKMIMNKNFYLSNYDKDEMYRDGLFVSLNFKDELFLHTKEFGLSPDQYIELCSDFDNFLSQSMRRPLFAGDRETLTKTHFENVQRVQQQITNMNEPRKKILGIF